MSDFPDNIFPDDPEYYEDEPPESNQYSDQYTDSPAIHGPTPSVVSDFREVTYDAPETETNNESEAQRRVPISSQSDILIESPDERSKAKKRRSTQSPRRSKQRSQSSDSILPTAWTLLKATGLTSIAAILVATIFSYWTPDDITPTDFRAQLQIAHVTDQALIPLASPIPIEATTPKIGIIAGHTGPPQDTSFEEDPGAICDENNDGVPELTEKEINESVSLLVATQLLAAGYEVEILEEFDPRLDNYRADALVSIHTNDCQNYGLGATGYNVAGPISRLAPRAFDQELVRCLINEYGAVTGLNRHTGLTEDMTSYHTFREVSDDTPVAIIEIGFMFADRQILTQGRETLADGIANGLLCFLEANSVDAPTLPTVEAQ
jgi:N-acetylmuramoyl-L-alanine amidase